MNSWDIATADLQAPLAVVDLDAFDANADAMVRRVNGKPIRVATKSVRCRAMLRRALDHTGYAGLMAFSAAEAAWLAREGFEDIYVAYPSADVPALREITADERLARTITLTIDSGEHVDFLHGLQGAHPFRVAVDVDASLLVGPLRLGVQRSRIRTPEQASSLARRAVDRGLRVVGMMIYDALIAGLPDSSGLVRLVKQGSQRDLLKRRCQLVQAVREVADLEFVNGGGTGSLHLIAEDDALTEAAAGSGLYSPTLFDNYRAFTHRPAAAFALPVVRHPAPGAVTVFSGGYIASGPTGESRAPVPFHPAGLRLSRTEGAGEVQTPLVGEAAGRLRIGDRVWLRHAKAGELAERFTDFQLVQGERVVDCVPTYRGEGKCFG